MHLTVGDIPRHFASLHTMRDRPVLVADERPITWAEIDDASSRLANGLLDAGLRPGSKVATFLSNRAEYPEIMYAIAKAGMTIVPLNSRYVAREVSHGVDFAEAEAVVTSPDLEPVAREALSGFDRLYVLGDGYERLKGRGGDPRIEVDDASVYWMPFTSGTTGDPKAAMVTHRALVDHWNVVVHTFEVSRRDTMLIAGPFYHSLGFLFGLTGLYAGGTIAIHSAFDPDRVLRAIEDLRVTMAPMVPTMYTMVLASDTRADVSSMRAVISAGSPLLTGTKDGLIELFGDAGLYEFYGSTEIGVATALGPADQHRKVRSVGLPVLGSEIVLLDADGNPASEGEVCKRGLLLSSGYFKNPEATEASSRPGGFVASGDLGRFDDEGYLSIVDRTKDMIISGGANVFPSEIEEVISKHPGVLEVAVIGVPDATWGEAIKAVVVRRGEVTADELLALCEANLGGYKKPRSIEFIDEMPKTGTGKILKRELRDRYWADQDARV